MDSEELIVRISAMIALYKMLVIDEKECIKRIKKIVSNVDLKRNYNG